MEAIHTPTEHADLWLPDVRYRPSPNFNQRPDNTEISLLVLHNISLPPGQFGGDAIERFFTNTLDYRQHPFFQEIATLKVSAHLLIRRDASVIQFVALNHRAWHAGQSCFRGAVNCNDFSIGIELEGTDTCPYTQAQYLRLVQVTRQIQGYYPAITTDRIAGHCDIAPDRKTDPGDAFDWSYFRRLLQT